MYETNKVKVWDPLVRMFHWVLVVAFILAYISEDDFLTIHVWAGYTIGIALVVRLLWGFVGARHARFTDFVTSPSAALAYLKDTLLLKARRYLGHNPAGGFMIILMLISLLVTTLTGIAVYGAEEQAGPLANTFAASYLDWGEIFEEIHEFFANFSLLLIFVHVAGVVVESLIHRENLVASMINGLKRAN